MANIIGRSETQVRESDIYDQFVIYKLVDKNHIDYDTNPVTSHSVWKDYFKEKALLYRSFDLGMRKVFRAIDRIYKKYSENTPPKSSVAKFGTLLSSFRAHEENLVTVVNRDSNLFSDLKNSMGTYLDIDKDMLILHNSEKQLSKARKDFFDQAKEVQQAKDKYHKAAFKQEKTEIQYELEEKKSEIDKLCVKFERLQKKVVETIKDYKEEFGKLKNRGKALKEKSYYYNQAKIRVDVKKADNILEQLTKYGTQASLQSEKLDSTDYTCKQINTTELVKCRQPKETIGILKMEKYQVCNDRKYLTEKVKREMAEERQRKARGERIVDSDGDDEEKNNDNENPDKTPVVPFVVEIDTSDETAWFPVAGPTACAFVDAGPSDSEVLGPSCAKVGQEYLILSSYRKQYPNQMNLRQGKKVKLILPPNEKGFAYGEKPGGMFGLKKIKGYFPWKCVAPNG